MSERRHRIGLIVPSSNVTVETELPMLLARHADAAFSFHGSRMRMQTVSPEGLRAMNEQRVRCVAELADAGVDAVLYGCLVAIMAEGAGAHRPTEQAMVAQFAAEGLAPAVTSSAGALVEVLQTKRVARVALVMPYVRALAERVVGYIEAEGIAVTAWAALEEPDNAAVSCISGERVMQAAGELDLRGADALVISACVQMPSLPLVEAAEQRFQLPVLPASTAGAYTLLGRLGLEQRLPGAGSLLSDRPWPVHA